MRVERSLVCGAVRLALIATAAACAHGGELPDGTGTMAGDAATSSDEASSGEPHDEDDAAADAGGADGASDVSVIDSWVDVAADRTDETPAADAPPTALDAAEDAAIDAHDGANSDAPLPDAPADATGSDATSDGPTSDAAADASDAGVCDPEAIRVNELQAKANGLARDEFVELYNPNPACAVSLAGWSLKYSSAGGSSPATYWSAATGDSIAARSFFVLAGPDFPGTSEGAMNNGLDNVGGAVGLFHGSKRVDAVAYGTASASNPLCESSPAPSIPDDRSIGRTPDGDDTDDNAHDFVVFSTPTPGRAN